MAHDQDVDVRQWVGEEVARRESQAVALTVLRDIGIEDRLNGWEVIATPGEMVVCGLVGYGDGALRTADVDHAAVVPPREFGCEGLARRKA